MVDYNLLNELLEAALAKETSESLNKWLDDCYEDSHLIDAVSTLDISSFRVSEPMIWSQGEIVAKKDAENVSGKDHNNPYAIAA